MKMKNITILLLVTILLQSCAVYQKTPVSIDEAAYSKAKKIKLITTTGNKILFKNIEKVDGLYYGELNSYKYHIPSNEVAAVYLYDKKKSGRRIIISTLIILTSLALLIFGPTWLW